MDCALEPQPYAADVQSPERPNRPALAAGAVLMLAGAGLLFSHYNDVTSLIGVIVLIVAVLCILKSMDWMFTRRL